MAPVDLSNDTKNWLKAVLALKHLKEGLRPFVDHHISAFHNNLIATYGTCNQCTTENILKCTTNNACWKNKKGICQYHDIGDPLRRYTPCPYNVCNNIRDEIVREHFKKQPMWKNTDAAKWSSDAWGVAKCFLPPGSKACASSADTDCTGILSLCLHFLPLTALVGHVKHEFEQNRDNRNVLMHSGRQEITDTERSSFINDAIRLLSTYQIPVSQHTQDCINTLTEIDSDGLVLTTDDVVGIMKDRVDAIRLKQEELATELQETKEKEDANAVAIVDHNTKIDSYKSDLKQMMDNHAGTKKEVDDGLKEVNSVLGTFKDQSNKELGELKNKMETIRKQNEDLIMQIQVLETTVKTNTTRLDKHDIQHTEHDKGHTEHTKILKEHGVGIKVNAEGIKENTEGIKQLKRRMDHQEDISNQRLSESSTRKKIRVDADTVAAAHSPDVQKMRGRTRLRDYLIKKYKNNYSDMLVAPPKKDMWTDIGKHYREQDMRQVSMPSESHTDTGEKKKTETVISYNDVFSRKDKQCRNIYVKGDAGSGKSVFCLHMVNTWCGIHSSDKEQDGVISSNKQKKDIDMLRQFEFLFYIELRYATDQYDIVSMIKENLLRNNKQLSDQLTDVLENESEKCLILLDGLDEWSIPKGSKPKQGITKGLPDRDDCSDWTILTTTRPWTLETIRPNRCEMDQLIELRGLTEGSIDETINSVVGYLNNRYSKDKSPLECSEYLCMNDLNHIPVVLKQLVCIWFEDGKVGKTKCDMYAAMVDVYLRYADLKINQDTLSDCDKMTSCNDLPACLQNREICQRLKQSLFKLSKLAFHTLFCKDRSSSLVFDSHTATIHGMSKEEVGLWLKIGLLSQDSIDRRRNKDEMMISFPHKTIQEFLAAVYMSMHTDPDNDVLPIVKDICGSVDMILEMSQVFIFLSGMAPAAVTTISQYISQVVSTNEDIQCYRNTGNSQMMIDSHAKQSYDRGTDAVRAIQRLMARCIRESLDTGLRNIEVHTQDLIIDVHVLRSCIVEELFRFNKSDIISFCVSLRDRIVPFESESKSVGWKEWKTNAYFPHLSKLKKFGVVVDGDNDDDNFVGSIIKRNIDTLTVISLGGLSFKQSTHDSLCNVLSGSCVQEVAFRSVVFDLHQLGQIRSLRRIHLENITCNNCTGPCLLDLSQLTRIQQLQLCNFCVDHVQINTSQLEKCEINGLRLVKSAGNQPMSTSIYLTFQGDSQPLRTLTLENFAVQCEQLKQLMLFVTQATGLQYITLNKIKCSDCGTGCTCRLDLSQHTQLDRVQLKELYMSDVQINTTKLQSCGMYELRLANCTPNELGSAETSRMFHGDGKQLVKLTLTNIVLKHEQLEQLMLSVTQATGMRKITLNKIKCSDCGTGCTCRLDLSQHTQLWDLEFEELYMSDVQINTTKLRSCTMNTLKLSSCTPNELGSAETSRMFHDDGKQLIELTLTDTVLKHEQLEQLMLSVTQATGLGSINLNKIKCSDCGTGCTCRLDLSQHTQLLRLELQELYVSDVQINTTRLWHLTLTNIVLKHEQLEQLMLSVTQATGLRYITLNKITCSDCGTGCTCRLDLSQHTQLLRLELQELYVSDVQINTTRLWHLTLTNIVLKHEQLEQLMLSVTQATGLRYITLNKITCSDCGTGCTCRLDLSQHTHLQELELQELYMSDVQINTTQLEYLMLTNIVLKHEQLEHLMLSVTHATGFLYISLTKIKCSDCRLDLSQHTHLRSLVLQELYMSDVQINTTRLEYLMLTNIVLKHEQLEQLILSVTQATELRYITLNEIKCSDCGTGCTCRLDLSQHTHLRALELQELYVSDVQINITQLEYLTLTNIVLNHEQLGQLMLSVTQATGLMRISLNEIKCSDCGTGCTCRLDLSQHTQLGGLWLEELYMSDVQINTTQLKYLMLTNIVLKHEQLEQLMLSVTQATGLEYITLNKITCSDCGTGCTCRLDLSQHTQLEKLELHELYEGDVQINITELWKLTLTHIVLKHEQLEQLMSSVTQATGLREITLNKITCSDCGTGCTCRLDLSQHTQLVGLRLEELYVSDVQINTTKLEVLILTNIVLKHEQLEQLMLSVTDAKGLRAIFLNKIKCSDCGTGCTYRLDLSQHTQLGGLRLEELYMSDVQINTTQLKHLKLTNIVLKHEQLEQLMSSVTQATGLQKVTLNKITCSDCGTGCSCRLDLSQHTQLEKLELHELYVSGVQINTTHLDRCTIDSLRLTSSTTNEPGSVGVSLMFRGVARHLNCLTLRNIALRHDHLMLIATLIHNVARTISDLSCVDCADKCELICENHWGRADVRIE